VILMIVSIAVFGMAHVKAMHCGPNIKATGTVGTSGAFRCWPKTEMAMDGIDCTSCRFRLARVKAMHRGPDDTETGTVGGSFWPPFPGQSEGHALLAKWSGD